MGKPFALWADFCFLRLLGPRLFTAYLKRGHRVLFSLPWNRAAVRGNIESALAHAGRPATPELMNALLEELAALYAERHRCLLTLDRLSDAELDAVALDALPAIRAALQGGRGVVLATAHWGNEILMLAALSRAGVTINVVIFDASVCRWAESETLRFLGVGEAGAACLAALARNEAVLVYCDLNFFPDGGMGPDFLGKPFPPPGAAARLARQSGAPLLPVYAAERGGRLRCECDPALDPGAGQEELELALLKSMEARIASAPGRWHLLRDAWDRRAGRLRG